MENCIHIACHFPHIILSHLLTAHVRIIKLNLTRGKCAINQIRCDLIIVVQISSVYVARLKICTCSKHSCTMQLDVIAFDANVKLEACVGRS